APVSRQRTRRAPDVESAGRRAGGRRVVARGRSRPRRAGRRLRFRIPRRSNSVRRMTSTRSIAGVSVPDTPLVTAAVEYAQRVSEPYLFHHAMRSWLFAEAIGRMNGIDYDHEVVAIGTLLHDIGLTASVSGSNRFEVNGADAAVSFIKNQGFSDRRAQLVWDLVALNSTPSLALHKEREVVVGTMGIGVDFGGFGIEKLPASDLDGI